MKKKVVHIGIAKKNAPQGVSRVLDNLELILIQHKFIRISEAFVLSDDENHKKQVVGGFLRFILSKLRQSKIFYYLHCLLLALRLVVKNRPLLKAARFVVVHDLFVLFWISVLEKDVKLCLFNHSNNDPFNILEKNNKSFFSSLLLSLHRKVYYQSKLTTIVCLNEVAKKDMSKKFPLSRVIISKNYITSRETASYDYSNNIFIIGTICERKRQLELIRRLNGLYFCGVLNFIGADPSGLLQSFEDENYVNPLGVTDDIRNVLSSGAIVLSVSSDEGMPVSLIEAISVGAVIISTDVGGCSDVCINGNNGFLLEKDFCIKTLVDSFHQIVSDIKLRERFSDFSKRHFYEHFGEEACRKIWHTIELETK